MSFKFSLYIVPFSPLLFTYFSSRCAFILRYQHTLVLLLNHCMLIYFPSKMISTVYLPKLSSPHPIPSPLHSTLYPLPSSQYTLSPPLFTVHSIPSPLHSTLYPLPSSQYTLSPPQYTLSPPLFIVHSIPPC